METEGQTEDVPRIGHDDEVLGTLNSDLQKMRQVERDLRLELEQQRL